MVIPLFIPESSSGITHEGGEQTVFVRPQASTSTVEINGFGISVVQLYGARHLCTKEKDHFSFPSIISFLALSENTVASLSHLFHIAQHTSHNRAQPLRTRLHLSMKAGP